MATRGDTFTGTITYNTGTTNQERWIYIDNAGQKARTLITTQAGPTDPTVDNMIKTDKTGFTNVALHLKTTKTVSGQNDIDFTVKRLYFWVGLDETHWCNLTFAGAGTIPCFAYASGGAAGYNQFDFNAAHLIIDNMAVNGTANAIVNFTTSGVAGQATSPWIVPYGIVGFMIQVQTAATPSITTSNTWTLEATWYYA